MFTQFPLALQILAWGVFMLLNGYICLQTPFANLAVLGFLGLLGFQHGGWWTALACGIILVQIPLYAIMDFGATNFLTGQGGLAFAGSGLGLFNLLLSLVLFFVLLGRLGPLLPQPAGWVMGILCLGYLAGLVLGGVAYYPLYVPLAILLLVLLCRPGVVLSGMGLILGTLAGLGAAGVAYVGVKEILAGFLRK